MLTTSMKWILKWLLAYCVPSVLGMKWLVENPTFDEPAAWSSDALPCALEDVVFPYNYPAVMPLPTAADIKGLILPANGAIMLNLDGTIQLGSGTVQRECENGKSRKAYLRIPAIKKWYDPNSWHVISRMANNRAVPTVEQMPCNNETVVIQAIGPLAIDMENTVFMRLGQLSLAGSILSKEYLQNLLNTDIGDILFKNTMGLKVEYYKRDVCGCQRDYGKFVEPICHNVAQSCARPHCLAPITPLGSCCAICGATLRFKVDKCADAVANKLRATVGKALKEQKLLNELDYHVNYYDLSELGFYLELIVVERSAYNERSVKFLAQLQRDTAWKSVLSAEHTLQGYFAGRPYNPNITFVSFMLIVLCLVFVGFVCLVIFAHYAPDNRYIRRLPQWTYDPRRWQSIFQRSHFVFARFDNIAAGATGAHVQIANSAGNVQESIIMGYDAESGEVRERAFDNPMFAEMQKSSAAAATAQPTPKTSKTTDTDAKTDKAANVATAQRLEQQDDEQELTEINLDSEAEDDDSDSDFHVETV